jgi:hypothetical protein
MSEHNVPMPDDLAIVWEAYLAGKATPADTEKLLRWLNQHPGTLDMLRNHARMHGALSYLLGPGAEAANFMAAVQTRFGQGVDESDSRRFKQELLQELNLPNRNARPLRRTARRARSNRLSSMALPLSAAALLAIGVFAAFYLSRPGAGPAPGDKAPAGPAAAVSPAVLTLKSGAAFVDLKALAILQPVELRSGNHVVLNADSVAVMRLADGSDLELKDGADLIVSGVGARKLFTLNRGRAAIQAQPQPADQPLTVLTPHSSIAVIGTRYSVDAFSTLTRVSVESGKVAVTGINATASQKQVLASGDEVIVDAEKVSEIQHVRGRRDIALDSVNAEQFTDPVVSTALQEKFRNQSLLRFAYMRPPVNSVGYAGLSWPVKLARNEGEIEIWLRPRKIKLFDEGSMFGKVVMLIQMGDTEYRAGDVWVWPGNNDWIVLRGKLAGAPVHWQNPDGKVVPPDTEQVRSIAIRTEICEIEFDHTAPIVIDTGK